MPNIQYFLGGNTPTGFYSLYHQLSDPARMRALYIIKGGPGSGKSTLMRRVERRARAAGLETEQVLCSGDPDSLDALILPQLRAALVDGTAPQAAATEGHFALGPVPSQGRLDLRRPRGYDGIKQPVRAVSKNL